MERNIETITSKLDVTNYDKMRLIIYVLVPVALRYSIETHFGTTTEIAEDVVVSGICGPPTEEDEDSFDDEDDIFASLPL